MTIVSQREPKKTLQSGKPPLTLETSLQYLKGVGPKLGTLLSKAGLTSVEDILRYYPRAYEDRRAARTISSLRPDDLVSLRARVFKVGSFKLGKSSRRMYDVLIRDSSGQIHCKYFRVPYKGYFERFQPGQEVRVIGKVTEYHGRLEFHHPDLREIVEDEEDTDALLPIYPEIDTLSTAKISRLIRICLEEIKAWPVEKFSQQLMIEQNLIPFWQAIKDLHLPNVEQAELYHQLKTAAHHRIIFEEFFWLELYLAAKKTGLQKEVGIPLQIKDPKESNSNKNSNENLIEKLKNSLPFELTKAQLKAFDEIRNDLAKPHPMYRLVQGDVGSGKTLVSFMATLVATSSGTQSCLMVPTEILAEQHYRNAVKFLEPLGARLGLLTGKSKASERLHLLERLKTGAIDLLIGTHALLEDPVQFQQLALVIIDEQHRFGVEQRAKLKAKGISPHFLVMTATPIPRTLAMTVYGDLEVSIINEMPKGRMPIQTRVVFESKRAQALDFMREQILKGRQAYIIYPLVEESEKIDLKDAVGEYEKLRSQYPDIPMGLMHGKMKSDEKEKVMDAFRVGEIKVLVSTTVIEVGVDVPNANLMIIEHAERFGLSQLHQLRGRVGRGDVKSFCVMILGHALSEEARERTAFMEKTSDGFKIAEFDLELRGPGEFLGRRQSGLPGFQMANLVRDVEILQQARNAAFKILERDPFLLSPENKMLREELLRAHGPTALASIA